MKLWEKSNFVVKSAENLFKVYCLVHFPQIDHMQGLIIGDADSNQLGLVSYYS